MKQFLSMLVRKEGLLIVLMICLIYFNTSGQQPAMKIKPVKTGYAAVNGIKAYYEIYGEGKPIVLLHGAYMNIPMNFDMIIPDLAKTRKVIAIEFQAHGRTADTDRPMSMETFADDVAGVIKELKLDSTDVLGYSLGGGVALQLAIRHPKLIRKLIIMSAPFKFEGWSPETRTIFPMVRPEWFEPTPIKSLYDSLAPDPKHWSAFVNKVAKFVSISYDYTEKARLVKSPTLIILGDADGILTEHAAEMYRIMGGGQNGDMAGVPRTQLAILPATPHTQIFAHPEWILPMITSFLDRK